MKVNVILIFILVMSFCKPAFAIDEISKPAIDIFGISEGDILDVEGLPTVNVTATSASGIEKIQMTERGFLLSQVSNDLADFSLEMLGVGRHAVNFTAFSNSGGTESIEVNIEIKGAIFNPIYSNDFSGYSGNNAIPSGMAGASQRGYLRSDTIKKEFGKSLIIGVNILEDLPTGSPPYISILPNEAKGRVKFDFDIYISGKTHPTGRYFFELRKNGGGSQEIARFSSSTLNFYNSSGVQSSALDYETEKWYHFEIIVDVAKKTFDITLDGTPVVTGGTLLGTIDTLSFLRIYGPNYYDREIFAAVDNLTVQNHENIPSIISVSSDNKDILDYRAEVLNIEMSSPVYKDKFNLNKISVESDLGNVEISSFSIENNLISLRLRQPMESNTAYCVKLDETTEFPSGIAFGSPVSYVFNTSMGDIEVINGAYVTTILDDDYFTADIVNNSGEEKKIYIISEIWEADNYFIKAKAEEIILSASGAVQNFSIETDELNSGECIKTYIWDSLSMPISLAKNVFKKY